MKKFILSMSAISILAFAAPALGQQNGLDDRIVLRPPLPGPHRSYLGAMTRPVYRHKIGWNKWGIPADYYYSADRTSFWLPNVIAYEREGGAHFRVMTRAPSEWEVPGCRPRRLNRCQATTPHDGAMNFLSQNCGGYRSVERVGFVCSRHVPGTKRVTQYAKAYQFTTTQGRAAHRTIYLASDNSIAGFTFNQVLGYFPE